MTLFIRIKTISASVCFILIIRRANKSMHQYVIKSGIRSETVHNLVHVNTFTSK
jgi:hypothetical protein